MDGMAIAAAAPASRVRRFTGPNPGWRAACVRPDFRRWQPFASENSGLDRRHFSPIRGGLGSRNRAPRTSRIVRESTEHGELFHITDAAEMRDAFIRKDIARSRREWLYCYDPMTVALP